MWNCSMKKMGGIPHENFAGRDRILVLHKYRTPTPLHPTRQRWSPLPPFPHFPVPPTLFLSLLWVSVSHVWSRLNPLLLGPTPHTFISLFVHILFLPLPTEHHVTSQQIPNTGERGTFPIIPLYSYSFTLIT